MRMLWISPMIVNVMYVDVNLTDPDGINRCDAL